MGAWTDTWYRETRAAMIKLRGSGGLGRDGVALPRMTAVDSIAVLSRVTNGLINAVRTFCESQKGGITLAALVGNDGRLIAPTGDMSSLVPYEEWLAGFPHQNSAWIRSTIDQSKIEAIGWGWEDSVPFYTFFIDTNESDYVAFLRGAVNRWQDAANVSAGMVATYAADASTPIDDADLVSSFWQAIRSVCLSLDTTAELPPKTEWEKVIEATAHAARESAGAAGALAANAANAAGEGAGLALEGFMKHASMLTMAVIAIAIYVAFV